MAKTAKKKRWVQIIAPKLFNGQMLGETLVLDVKEALGRRVVTGTQALGVEGRHKANVEFEVVDTGGERLATQIVGYNISKAIVKRMIKRNRERVDDSFVLETQDDKQVRIKPLLVTRFSTSNAVTTAIRKRARGILALAVKKATYDQFMEQLISHRLQRQLFDKLKKIYPLATCEIRKVELLKTKAKTGVIKVDDAMIKEAPKAEA